MMEDSMKRAVPWVLIFASLAWCRLSPATVGVPVPLGPGYQKSAAACPAASCLRGTRGAGVRG